MDIPGDPFNSDDSRIYDRENRWQDTLNLLKLVRFDYQEVREQLQETILRLSARESLVDKYLQNSYISAGKFKALCLVEYRFGDNVSRMGNTILGETLHPSPIPLTYEIKVRCLGHFEVRSSFEHVVKWESLKARSVFQYLLLNPREATLKEAILEALWPECAPRAAENNLKAAVHSLRQTLSRLRPEKDSSHFIQFNQGSYLINPGTKLWIDIEEFEKHCYAGRCLEREGKTDAAMCEFERAEELYTGDFLEDEIYVEWTLFRRERLKDLYLNILDKLADYYMRTSDYENCIHYTQKILTKDNCREDAYRRLMYCYTKMGQRNRALRWYEICYQTIKSEMDSLPEEETLNLYYRIHKGSPV